MISVLSPYLSPQTAASGSRLTPSICRQAGGDQWFADSPPEGDGFELPVRGDKLAATLGKIANVFEGFRGASAQERWIATIPRRRASRSRQALRARAAAIGWR